METPRTEIALAGAGIPRVDDMVLLADNPQDMLGAQARLVLWCEQKIGQCDAQRHEAKGNAARAKESKWPGEEKRWKRVAGRQRAMIEFYTKVKLALEAGYYIVPPFPGQVFAIRVKKHTLPDTERSYHSTQRSNDHEVGEHTLPAGEGVYQNPYPKVRNYTDRSKDATGKEVVTRWSRGDDWMPMEFPIGLVKTAILDAATKALGLKIFDRLTILPATRRPDPIVMGEINMPHRKGERVSFFVAWWLDTKSL